MLNTKSLAFILLSLLVAACTKKAATESNTPMTQEQLVERGRQMFLMNCTSCHGNDPLKEGPVGPSIAGSSLELLTARVLRAQYPAGYKPKRTTGIMVALPHMEKELPALHAYLNSVH